MPVDNNQQAIPPWASKCSFDHLSPDWRACIETFLQNVLARSGSEATARNYRDILLRFAAMCPDLSAVTRTDVERFAHLPKEWPPSQRGKAVSASTFNQRVATLVSLYKHASSFYVSPGAGLDSVPLYNRALPTAGVKYVKHQMSPRALSQSELTALFMSFDRDTPQGKRDFAITWLFFTSARRRHEIGSLLWGDISAETIVDDQGAHEGYCIYFTPKGASAARVRCEILPSAYDSIVDYLVASGRMPTMRADSPLFAASPRNGRAGRKGKKPYLGTGALDEEQINHNFKLQCARAGIQMRPGLSLHSLRHSSASQRRACGDDVYAIMAALGHKDLGVTARYLATLTDGASDKGAHKLEARFAMVTSAKH